MSTNLQWRPLESGKSLCYELKVIFRNMGIYGNQSRAVLNYNNIEFLKGVKAGTSNEVLIVDIDTLITAIEMYSEIEIYEE